jgi:DNA-binding beta-propeller fold protein YncE
MTAKQCLAGAAIVLIAAQAASAGEVWRADGFEGPETALLDPDRGVIYVSNIAGEMTGKDGAGYISRVALDGTVEDRQWATGLDAPKGLAIGGDSLCAADIDQLVAIDIETGEVSGRWPAEGAAFLNDVAVDEQGRVFVSDTVGNRIYVLDGDAISVWAEGDALLHPNGLAVDGGKLIVAAWGDGLREDLTTEVPGHLLAADLATGDIATMGSGAPVGNLDGLEPDGAGNWIVTDWIGGALYLIDSAGGFELLADLPQGSANLAYLPEEKLAIVPQMLDGTVVAMTPD